VGANADRVAKAGANVTDIVRNNGAETWQKLSTNRTVNTLTSISEIERTT
jgi:hypothetical protein